MTDGTIDQSVTLPDGRTVGFADFAPDAPHPVLWCHGGPGSRLEPALVAARAAELGLRIVGIDRPGYGLSTPRPGRSIEAGVPDLVAVADHLGLDVFHVVGVSTGGAYALAAAAIEPTRVLGAVVCCGLTDMRDPEARAAMAGDGDGIAKIWNAATRDEALTIATEQFGDDGTRLLQAAGDTPLAPADAEMFADPEALAAMASSFPAMFAWGVQGYADDRLADRSGWVGFVVSAVKCPVVVAHGTEDTICPPINAETTAARIPQAQLRWFDGEGHFSVVRHVPDVLADMVRNPE